jgi:hypothetical protein
MRWNEEEWRYDANGGWVVGRWSDGGVTVRKGILLFKSLEFNSEMGWSTEKSHCRAFIGIPIQARLSR